MYICWEPVWSRRWSPQASMLNALVSWEEGVARKILSLVEHAPEALACSSILASVVDNDCRAIHIGLGW